MKNAVTKNGSNAKKYSIIKLLKMKIGRCQLLLIRL